MALWGARFSGETNKMVEAFSSSIDIDQRLWKVDIRSSIAHAQMLGHQHILEQNDVTDIVNGLKQIESDLSDKRWSFPIDAEDIHGALEDRLFELIGEPAKRLHTARSRNDQIATDTRLFLSESVEQLLEDLNDLKKMFLKHAEENINTLLPGLTHFQNAQPVSLAHHLLSYFWMLERDCQRLRQSLPRILQLPLGSAALAGTGFQLDRQMVAKKLGFHGVIANSMDAVSDRDFVIEFLSDSSICMMHLSRFCEEIILWNSQAFQFVELGDAVTTGSSIMPQKKNPDVAELIRGRVGRSYGALIGALTMMKALPLTYNRDMQDDKVHLFQGLDNVMSCVRLTTIMLQNLKWRSDRMAQALSGDFSNATDLADDLVKKGISFREAHEIVGRIVKSCLANGQYLENLSQSELKLHHPLFDQRSVEVLKHVAVMSARVSEGGTAPAAVKEQLEKARRITDFKN